MREGLIRLEGRLGQIQALLMAYTPADDRESRDLDRMLALLSGTADPVSRRQYEPGHFTASAFVVSRDAPEALLIHHPTLSIWLQPGGHLEPEDASPVDGARREVLEETGLDAFIENQLFDLDVHEIPARGDMPPHLHFDLRFLALVDGRPAASSAEGVVARWMPLTEVLTFATDASVQRMARKRMA